MSVSVLSEPRGRRGTSLCALPEFWSTGPHDQCKNDRSKARRSFVVKRFVSEPAVASSWTQWVVFNKKVLQETTQGRREQFRWPNRHYKFRIVKMGFKHCLVNGRKQNEQTYVRPSWILFHIMIYCLIWKATKFLWAGSFLATKHFVAE